jgi:hypothetical protein
MIYSKWIIIDGARKGARRNFKYAGKIPVPASSVKEDEGSSSENTDDETYLTRHRPYEEQEIRFRYPKLVERERKYKEALRREGLEVPLTHEAEERYKSLWYSGR